MPNRTPEYMAAYYAANRDKLLARRRAHYQENRERVDAYNAERRVQVKAQLDDLKRGPCTDCGISYPPYVMDWDHVRGEKVTNIAKVARNWSIERLMEEIAKCDLVCSNCHRERTFGKPSTIIPDIDVR